MTAEVIEQAHLLCDMRRPAEAADLATRLLAQDPQNVRAWLVLARARLAADDSAGGLDAAATAAGLAPGLPSVHAMVGMALGDMARYDEAAAALRRAVSLEPDNADWHELLAGTLNAAEVNLSEALNAAQTAVRLAPDRPSAYVTYGTALAATGYRTAAQDAFRHALALDPQSAAAHHELARVKADGRNGLAAGGLADAATGFATAVRLDPYAQASRENLDQVLRLFLVRTSYLLMVLAITVARAAHNHPGFSRLAAVAGIAVPVGYACRFIYRLAPAVRPHLRDVVTTPRMRIIIVVAVFAEILLVGATLLPRYVWPMAIAAAVAAIAVRILVHLAAGRYLVRSDSGRPYLIGTPTLVFVSVVSVLCTLAMLSASLTTKDLGLAAITALLAILSAGCIGLVVARRRRRRAHRS